MNDDNMTHEAEEKKEEGAEVETHEEHQPATDGQEV